MGGGGSKKKKGEGGMGGGGERGIPTNERLTLSVLLCV